MRGRIDAWFSQEMSGEMFFLGKVNGSHEQHGVKTTCQNTELTRVKKINASLCGHPLRPLAERLSAWFLALTLPQASPPPRNVRVRPPTPHLKAIECPAKFQSCWIEIATAIRSGRGGQRGGCHHPTTLLPWQQEVTSATTMQP